MSFKRETNATSSMPTAGNGLFLNKIQTPNVIVSSYLGNPSYVTPDCLNESNSAYLSQLEIADLCHKDFFGTSLSDLRKDIPNNVSILSSRNMISNVASSDANGLFIETFGGRYHVKVSDYIARIGIDQPTALIAMADEININSGRKRLTKSIERSSAWFQSLISSAELGALKGTEKQPFVFGVGIAIPELPQHIGKYCSDLVAHGAKGIVVGGAHMGESEVQRNEVIRSIRAAVGSDVPLLIQGADTIRNIILAVSSGVDLVSSNYPSIVTSKGYAISFGAHRVLKTAQDTPVAVVAESGTKRSFLNAFNDDEDDEAVDRAPAKKPTPQLSQQKKKKGTEADTERVANVTGQTGGDITTGTEGADKGDSAKPQYPSRPKHNQKLNSHNTSKNNTNQHKPVGQCSPEVDASIEQCVVDLWDKAYCKDTQPLVVGCTCHACTYHTRAYIHHLLIAKEMLAEVLLYRHNQHQVLQLLSDARKHIGEGSYDKWSTDLLNSLV